MAIDESILENLRSLSDSELQEKIIAERSRLGLLAVGLPAVHSASSTATFSTSTVAETQARNEVFSSFSEGDKSATSVAMDSLNALKDRARDAAKKAVQRFDGDREVTKAFASLELQPSASAADVQRQYELLVARYHPSKFESDAERYRTAAEVVAKLSRAYQLALAHAKS